MARHEERFSLGEGSETNGRKFGTEKGAGQKNMSSYAQRWLERREKEKRKINFEKTCKEAIVGRVYDLFSREYEFQMMEETHEPQTSFEEEMLLALESYWNEWSEGYRYEDDIPVIDFAYVAQECA